MSQAAAFCSLLDDFGTPEPRAKVRSTGAFGSLESGDYRAALVLPVALTSCAFGDVAKLGRAGA